ncbi:MAG: MASE1 domain-containing protein [Chryseolinea sp.]
MVDKLSLKYKPDLKIIGVALLYYLSAKLGYFFAFDKTMAMPAWPPAGIGFALLILLGRAAWPGITIGALLANVLMYWNTPNVSASVIISSSTMIAIGNTLEPLLGCQLLKRWIKDPYIFNTPRNAFRFLFITLIMSAVGALIGTLSMYVNNPKGATVFLRIGYSWWVGTVVGILLFTPFILTIVRRTYFKFSPDKTLELGMFLLNVIGILLLLRVEYLRTTLIHAMPFLMLPLLLWLAFRFDLMIALAGVLLVSLISIHLTKSGIGPFVLANSYSSMLLLQIYVGVMSISTMILSATVREVGEVQRKLELFNENLEGMVLDRTRALNDEISTRKEAESKLLQTNVELSKRNTELDNFVYSVSHDLRAPIASVLGLINLAKKDKNKAMKDVYLDMIHKSAIRQDDFIKEILDQSRNSRLDVKCDEIAFEQLIDETFAHLSHATNPEQPVQKDVTIVQSVPFHSDHWRIKVILNNLISNAIRYRNGKDPLIKVNVNVDSSQATMTIEDNGKGISSEHLPNVCKMFYRGTDDGAGSGLGLYIVKEAVDKLRGSVEIASEEGKGTLVTLCIPALSQSLALITQPREE